MVDDPADNPKLDPAPKAGDVPGNWIDTLARSAAVLGAFIAAGQTASKIVESYYNQQIAITKANTELDIGRQKAESALATDFLNLILKKETTERNRSLILDALSFLPTHPLQQWAKEKHQAIAAELAAIDRAHQERLSAQSEDNPQARLVNDLRAQQDELGAQILFFEEDPERVSQLRDQQIVIAHQIAATLQPPNSVVENNAVASVKTATVTSVNFVIPLDQIKHRIVDYFSGGPKDKDNVDRIVDLYIPPLQEELKKCGVDDATSLANVLGQVANETAGFRTVQEYASGKEYEGRTELGNTNPGDGPRFKSRGLLGFPTGRANYTSLSQELGYGNRLVDSPEDVLTPEIAAQAVCYYLKKSGQKMFDALKNDDVVTVTKLLTGGTNGLATRKDFVSIFKEILSQKNTANVKQ